MYSFKRIFLWVFITHLAAGLMACGGSSGGGNNSDNASNASSSSASSTVTGSHNAGQDCLSSGCHAAGGSGTEFKAAGTVYQSGGGAQTNAEVRLYIRNTNTLAAQMSTDTSGNFYTTRDVEGLFTGGDLVTGVDVEVEGPGGIRTMPGLVTNGSCNSCHGASVGNIVAN